ncbi:MAG TPA: hypothetical protein VJL58_00560 [Pyrinomonadaceae bacterium]|nr:hypothetical protein [Pyrinomonadaceae bacterium]
MSGGNVQGDLAGVARENESSGGRVFWPGDIKRIKLAAIALFALVAFSFVAKPVGSEIVAFFGWDQQIVQNAASMLAEGRQTFRNDTFGDEAFWGGQLRLHDTIKGAANGGEGSGLSPRTALSLGLKVDLDALPQKLRNDLRQGRVNLDDPSVTVALLKLDSVVGVKGFFTGDDLSSVGITCALCHSTVDNSFAPGIGTRLDGWANRDLNVGEVVAFAPDLSPFATLLGISQDQVRAVLRSWGPGKFDAELILDGKAVNPQQVSNGVVTGVNVPAATLIPPAYGMAGVNLHTWTGWGSVTHWNAFVANLEMHGKGTFVDSRLNDPVKFPIAAANGFANVRNTPDLITPKLPALHFYQLAIPAPTPPAGSFDTVAATSGKELFNGVAGCNFCHVEPIFTEPGWNMHTPAEVCIDGFQAHRSPDERYRTSPLKGLWAHQTGGFFHDGRFATLLDVVNHYNTCFSLGLNTSQKRDLVEYLKSL